VIRSIRFRSLIAAGLVALFGAAGPAAAHQQPAPPREVHPAEPSPTTGEPGPQASSGIHSLRELEGGARATVLGTVSRTDAFDDQKLLVYRVAVERVLRGEGVGPVLSVVDIRAGLTRAPLLQDGQRAVLLVTPAPSLSYLTQQLPGEGPLHQLADGRDGIIPVATDADIDVVVGLLDAEDRVRAAPDPETRERELRRLAFQLLATGQPRLAADGLLELRRLPPVLSLTSEELSALGRVLRDSGIPQPTRIGLIRLLGQRHWEGALAALQGVEVDAPDVLAALLEARANLGAPATRGDLAPYLASKDPAVQAAAVAALARTNEPGTIDELGRWAVADGDRTVRESAIVALGRSKRPEASRYLQQTFASPDRFLMQASARALLDLDEADGNAAFTELALHGGSSDVRRYAALLLVMTRGRESPAVQQLLARNPDPAVRYVIEHGIEMHDVHGNN
jgi:HEAT repeat protein